MGKKPVTAGSFEPSKMGEEKPLSRNYDTNGLIVDSTILCP